MSGLLMDEQQLSVCVGPTEGEGDRDGDTERPGESTRRVGTPESASTNHELDNNV